MKRWRSQNLRRSLSSERHLSALTHLHKPKQYEDSRRKWRVLIGRDHRLRGEERLRRKRFENNAYFERKLSRDFTSKLETRNSPTTMSLIGLYRVMAPTSFIVMFSLMISPWLRSLSFPVISLRRFALLKRMVLEEVSGRPMTARTKAAPLEKRRGQRDHLHPRAWVVNEPITGPTVRRREKRERKRERDRNV